jgi:AcrR family transcriptional regulator
VRSQILSAGLTVFGAEGLRELTQTRVAEQAGVRQSHLTYYFPTRHDLLEALTTLFVNEMSAELGKLIQADEPLDAQGLARLARGIADEEHMRIFIGIIVEADGDPKVRDVVVRATRRFEAALAEAIGGEDAALRARVVLSTLWGLGLYQFAMRPAAASAPAALSLESLGKLIGAPARRRRKA